MAQLRRPLTEPPPASAGSLIVIPTYDERANLAALVAAVLRSAPAAELLIVDDGAPDGTGVGWRLRFAARQNAA